MPDQGSSCLEELTWTLRLRRFGRPTLSLCSRFVLLGLLLTAAPSAARAQNDGAYLLFSDPAYTSCSLVDVADQEYTVYIVHVDYDGVLFAEFRIVGTTELTYVGEHIPWASLGDTRNGLAVSYDECVSGEILVGEVTYLGSGTSSSCSYLEVLELNLDLGLRAVNCLLEQIVPFAGRLVINPDPTCPCEPVVPVGETSWGRIKALYE